MKRRHFIELGALAGAGMLLDLPVARAQGARTPGATVQTSSGRIRGYLDNQVHVFKGIPYGASTAGAGRFMPPREPQPWTGVRDASEYGPRAPQILGGEPPEMLPTDPREPQGEACLVLNLWTPAPRAGERRPVMVWLHGGGFSSGSGSYGIYSGRELARKHGVVAISVNHRLNVLGFLHLAQYGGKWANATNAGVLDLVRALQWVKENVAEFGGDPGNVTVFGQSGGAGKVSTLMAMPSARGLFHRAVAQSGSAVTAMPAAQAARNAEMLLRRLALTPDRLDEIQSVPVERLIAAMRPAGDGPDAGPLNFGPVVDGTVLPGNPFDPAAPAQSASVPFLTGTTATETTFFTPDERLHPIDDAEFRSRVKALLKVEDAAADRMIALYRKQQPGRDNIDLYLRMESDASRFREGVELQAVRKATQPAPVYMYRFEYYSPVREGRLRAMHCMEIPFVFDNLEAGKIFTGSGPEAQRIADQMSAAWVAFARTGNPSHAGIPQWTPFDPDRRATMIFGAGAEAQLVNDPGREERLALAAIRSARG